MMEERWQRIINVSSKDKTTNWTSHDKNSTTKDRKRIQINKTALVWLFHMDGRPAYTKASNILWGSRIWQRTRQPRMNWRGTVREEQPEAASLDRQQWHRRVSQCVHMDVG